MEPGWSEMARVGVWPPYTAKYKARKYGWMSRLFLAPVLDALNGISCVLFEMRYVIAEQLGEVNQIRKELTQMADDGKVVAEEVHNLADAVNLLVDVITELRAALGTEINDPALDAKVAAAIAKAEAALNPAPAPAPEA